MNTSIRKTFVLLFCLNISLSSFARSTQEEGIERQINELLKAREEMIKSLLNDSGFQNFDKRFEDLIKRFDQDHFNLVPGMDEAGVIGEYDWRETATHQVFVLKVKQIKDKPLAIKIEKGQIKLKGDVESVEVKNQKSSKSTSITKVHFERNFVIPDDVDQNSPEFENRAGELLIKFKKLKPTTAPPKINHKAPTEQPRPIAKDADDLTI